MKALARGIAVSLFVVAIGSCASQISPPSSTPATTLIATAAVTASVPTSTPTSPPTVVTPIPTGAVSTCGLLTRYASDVYIRLLTIDVAGTSTQYRLQLPGTAPADLPTNQLVRVTGRRIPADSGTPQAINLTDYTATIANTC